MDASWLFHRLRTMTPAETARHAWRLGRDQVWKRRSWKAPVPSVLTAAAPWPVPEDAKDVIGRAEGLLGRRIQVFSLPPEQPFEWTVDARSGLRAPDGYGPRLDYRDTATVGSAKNVWEKGRHHHWPVLALAQRATGDERFGTEVVEQARSWVAECPFPRGIQWSSALEAGMRLVSWVWTERLLRGSAAHGELFGPKGLLWGEAYWHQWALERWLSGGSSANNHLIGESAGLCLAATAWPVFHESRRWAAKAREVVLRDALAQFFPSGLNREMGFSYHLYSAELVLLALAEMQRAGEPVPPSAWRAMARAAALVPALRDVGGNLPSYGDSDDAFTLWVEPSGRRREAFLLGLTARLFGAPAEASVGAELVCHGLPPTGVPSAVVPMQDGSLSIEDAGVYVLARRRGTPRERFVLADAGPLGYGRMRAHGHSDALAFTFSVGGHPVLVDPGTGDYHGDPALRTYLRGVAAHTTISLDGQDQAVSRGLFLWHEPYHAEASRWRVGPDRVEWEGRHDGYARLPGKPIHRRSLSLDDAGLSVEDRVEGGGEHLLETRFQFHPDCAVAIEGDAAVAAGAFGTCRLGLDPRLEWRLLRGQADGGWFSPSFGAKVPSPTLAGRARVTLPFITNARLEVADAR
jgi:hypothetical protein